jgi:hypothetical protein
MVMLSWQVYSGGTVPQRYAAAYEWLTAAQAIDASLKFKGSFSFLEGQRTYPVTEQESQRLVFEFESNIILPEENLL